MSTTALRHLSPDQLLAREQECGEYVLIDVRTPAEFAESHIQGAVNVPLGDLHALMPKVADSISGKDIVLVCRSGQRAQKALSLMSKPDNKEIYVLEGGVAAWDAKGLPLLRGRKTVSLERQVRIAAGALVLAGSLLAFFVSPWLWALPAFVGAGLVFAGITDTCGMAMVLAKMPWNRRQGSSCEPSTPSSGCCG